MNLFRRFFIVLLIVGTPVAHAQKPPAKVSLKPIETTACKILEDPSTYNDKLVRVRGAVHVSFEYSILEGPGCPKVIWFSLADGGALPGLGAIVIGKGIPGSTDSNGTRRPPQSIHLVRDASYDQLVGYLQASAKGESCLEGPPPSSAPPDCRTYRVTATFTGRIDSVSKEVHAAHAKRSSHDPVDGKGFGHMGMFDAQLVVQSVEDVTVADPSAPVTAQPTHP
jgi:hypothetical protein